MVRAKRNPGSGSRFRDQTDLSNGSRVPELSSENGPCPGAKDDPAHARRKVGQDGYCYTCHYVRKRRRRTLNRASSTLRKYGLSAEDVAALKASQRGPDGKVKCACGRTIGVTREPCIDHWHGCPHCSGAGCRRCVRGLLCSPCNVYLGYIGDRPGALTALLWHLQARPAQRVLTTLDRGGTMDMSAGNGGSGQA